VQLLFYIGGSQVLILPRQIFCCHPSLLLLGDLFIVGVSSFVFTIIITHCVNQQCAILLIISRAHVLVISTMSRVKCTFNRWRTVVSGTWKYDNPRLTRLRPHVTFSTSGHHNFHVPRTTVSYVLSYGQLQESWIISGLQWRLAKREWVSSAM